MKQIVRLLWIIVFPAQCVGVWGVMTGRTPIDSWLSVGGVLLTILWLIPASVMAEGEYRAGTMSPLDSFGFKIVCYLFALPILVLSINMTVTYLSFI